MYIDLHPIYECGSCKAIIDEMNIVKTLHIKHSPVCGCCDLLLLKIED